MSRDLCMLDNVVDLDEGVTGKILIAGWRRQWSDGGNLSGGLPRYLKEQSDAPLVGKLISDVNSMCYPFQVAGTHDAFRPGISFDDGLPKRSMYRNNRFFQFSDDVIIFIGEEPWYQIDVYADAFYKAAKHFGVKDVIFVEGYNGPAPPKIERRISCIYSKSAMRERLDKFGLTYSSYGSRSRQGPTIGMALLSIASERYIDLDVLRLGAMAPLYPFVTENNSQVGITTDHRSYYDILRRIRAMYNLEIDLNELKQLSDAEGNKLQSTLETIAAKNTGAQEFISKIESEFDYKPFSETINIDPVLDRALEDILNNMSEEE
jgi:hypothetical protein